MAEKVKGEVLDTKTEMRTSAIAKIKSFGVDPKSKVVKLALLLTFVEIETSVKLLTALNTDITIMAKNSIGQKMNLGVFKVGGQSFDLNGNCTVTFRTMCESANLDKITSLLQDEENVFQVMFKAVLIDEEN